MGSRDKPRDEAQKTFKNNPFASLSGLQVTIGKEGESSRDLPKPDAPPRPHKSRGRLVLRRETKHRAGRAAIVIAGFSELRDFDAKATDALAKELKQQLGCGGTVEVTDGLREIVLQGDKAAKLAELLRARGFRVDGVTA